MNDHNLFTITQSGLFLKLRVLDLRGHLTRYPMTLKANFQKFDVPLLEELYLEFQLQKAQIEIVSKKEMDNFS
jgi:hypothetical protein